MLGENDIGAGWLGLMYDCMDAGGRATQEQLPSNLIVTKFLRIFG